MKVLVIGGADYLGGVVVEQLAKHGHESFASECADAATLAGGMREREIEAVMFLAASELGMADPQTCYQRIVSDGLQVLNALAQTSVKRLVLASTAAVYGAPEQIPVKETAPLHPVNALGEAALAFERALPWYESAYGIRSATMRCFNLAGATEHQRAAHPDSLIAAILRAAAGQAEQVDIFGEDYATPDKTCIRDYLHVLDAAEALVLALKSIEQESKTYNVGYGSGYSVAEVVEMARQITGVAIVTESAPRRAGDVPVLIANADKAMLELGWHPRYSELDSIIASAWEGEG